jgi:hypothetical protein
MTYTVSVWRKPQSNKQNSYYGLFHFIIIHQKHIQFIACRHFYCVYLMIKYQFCHNRNNASKIFALPKLTWRYIVIRNMIWNKFEINYTPREKIGGWYQYEKVLWIIHQISLYMYMYEFVRHIGVQTAICVWNRSFHCKHRWNYRKVEINTIIYLL